MLTACSTLSPEESFAFFTTPIIGGNMQVKFEMNSKNVSRIARRGFFIGFHLPSIEFPKVVENDLDMELTKFHDTVNASKTKFKGLAEFVGATFLGEASFDEATFKESAWFHQAKFLRRASFYGSFFFWTC
jgi:hypothetical protein